MTAKPSSAGQDSGQNPGKFAQGVPSSFGKADDPSMNDILASIRRVLNEEENVSHSQNPAPQPSPAAGAPSDADKAGSDDVFLLDQSMLTPGTPSAPSPASAPSGSGIGSVYGSGAAPGGMVAPSAMAAAASSVGQLVRQVSQRSTAAPRDGTLVEDLVRDAVQPLLKDWLDRNLPPLVERLVQAEIKKMMNQAMADA